MWDKYYFLFMQYVILSIPLPFCSYLFPPSWWGACAQRGSVESSVRKLQTYAKANPVSEAFSVSQRQSPDSLPVESVPKMLSLEENRDTSALSMVCSALCSHIIRCVPSRILILISLLLLCIPFRHVQPSFPLPLPQRCRLPQHQTKLHLHM